MSRYKKYLPFFIAFSGGTCMILGAYRGELVTMYAKAINICLECIGIG